MTKSRSSWGMKFRTRCASTRASRCRRLSRRSLALVVAPRSPFALAAALRGLGQGSADMAGVAYQALIATRFSRTDENEADRIGLELTARAGYDPRAGGTLWQKN